MRKKRSSSKKARNRPLPLFSIPTMNKVNSLPDDLMTRGSHLLVFLVPVKPKPKAKAAPIVKPVQDDDSNDLPSPPKTHTDALDSGDDYFGSEIDISAIDETVPATTQTTQPKPTASKGLAKFSATATTPVASRPMSKASASGSGSGTGAIKTKAELAKQVGLSLLPRSRSTLTLHRMIEGEE